MSQTNIDFMMNEESKDFLQCPFCGRRDELVITHIYDGENYVQCSRCRTGEIPRLVWNHRAESNPFSERVWLEEELKEKEFLLSQAPEGDNIKWLEKRVRLLKARLKEFDKEDGDGKVYNK